MPCAGSRGAGAMKLYARDGGDGEGAVASPPALLLITRYHYHQRRSRPPPYTLSRRLCSYCVA